MQFGVVFVGHEVGSRCFDFYRYSVIFEFVISTPGPTSSDACGKKEEDLSTESNASASVQSTTIYNSYSERKEGGGEDGKTQDACRRGGIFEIQYTNTFVVRKLLNTYHFVEKQLESG